MRDLSAEKQGESATAYLAFAHGVRDRLEIGAALPYVLASDTTTMRANGEIRTESSAGLGNPSFRARYALARGGGFAVTIGVLATPDWGGGQRGVASSDDRVEPFVVVGTPLGATQTYLRYGYVYRSGEAADADRLTLGVRRTIGLGYGMFGWVSYASLHASENSARTGLWRAALGGFFSLPDALQLVLWAGAARAEEGEARSDEASTRQMGLSVIRRF